MRFIEALSYSGADYLMKQKGENHEKRRVYFYGFQIVIGAVVKFLILLVLALVTDTLVQTFLMTIVFASLRMIAGGYHMDTFGRCLPLYLCFWYFLDSTLYPSILVQCQIIIFAIIAMLFIFVV